MEFCSFFISTGTVDSAYYVAKRATSWMSAEIPISYFCKSCQGACEHGIFDIELQNNNWCYQIASFCNCGTAYTELAAHILSLFGKLLKPLSTFCPIGAGKRGIHYHRVDRRGNNWIWAVERNPFPGRPAVLWCHPISSGMVSHWAWCMVSEPWWLGLLVVMDC